MKRDGLYPTVQVERALLVGVESKEGKGNWSIEDSLDELEQLARTAGAEVVGRVIQRLPRPSSKHYVGSGKLEEIAQLKYQLGYTMVICDDELTPVQQRNLEEALKVKVIDRTILILDIFARHARTKEGKLQVELAQYQYLMPRLIGMWKHLERLGGGIGTRGPGESQLETDRRLIKEKLHRLREELEEVRRHRELHRIKRRKGGIPVVSIVGYTNAGKSTLFNALCKAQVKVEDKLFATLDPTTRRLTLPGGRLTLLTDTVGFIHKLPPTLVAAFRATLEELEEASLLLHVVDITQRNAREQCLTVENILSELGLSAKPRILVFNKIDLLPSGQSLKSNTPDTVFISASKGWGLNNLLSLIERKLEALDYVKPPSGGLVRTI